MTRAPEPHPAGSRPDEPRRPVALVSFPKCGRTWLKLMLKSYYERIFGVGPLAVDGDKDWHRVDSRIPKLVIRHDDDPHFKRADELRRDRTEFAASNVVLLVRDPRDVMVSLYFEMTKRIHFYEDWGFDTRRAKEHTDDIAAFIRGPVGRLDSLIAYYDLWAAARAQVAGFLVVGYEAMHADAEAELARVIEFFGLPCDRDAIGAAVDACRFERMRKKEAAGAFDSVTLRPGDRADPESFKVRRGKVGGYAEYLAPEDVAWIDARCAALPEYLAGYRTSATEGSHE